MLKSDLHNNRLAMIILTLITALNIGLAINFLVPSISNAVLGLGTVQLVVLIGLELLAIVTCYVAARRNTTTVAF